METKIIDFSKIPRYNNRNGYTDWLKDQTWSFYFTGTCRYELTLNSARRLAERWWDAIRLKNREARMFWAAEPFDTKEGHHIHGLFFLPGNIDQGVFITLINLWQWCTGNKVVSIEKDTNKVQWDKLKWNAVNLRHYDTSRNAGGYCGKYINKNKADYDFLLGDTTLMSTCNIKDEDYCPPRERKRKGEVYHINRALLRSYSN